jgi:3-isopropylmalate dehydratase small subunit
MNISGRIFKLPAECWDNINTDIIIPGCYLRLPEEELASHAMGNVLPTFSTDIKGCSILVAGSNMGCGSSREQAPKALLGCGVRLVIAASFSHIFYRNAINLGLAALLLSDTNALTSLCTGQLADVDLSAGLIRLETGTIIKAQPLSLYILRILKAGGLLPLLGENPEALA